MHDIITLFFVLVGAYTIGCAVAKYITFPIYRYARRLGYHIGIWLTKV